MGVMTAIALGVTALGMARQQTAAESAAELSEIQAESDRRSFESMGERMAKSQRYIRGKARGKLAQGAGVGQDQALMVEADLQNNMFQDLAELHTRGTTAVARGAATASLYRDEAAAAMISGAGQLLKQGYSGYQNYLDGKKD